jgi:hypothetical protein
MSGGKFVLRLKNYIQHEDYVSGTIKYNLTPAADISTVTIDPPSNIGYTSSSFNSGTGVFTINISSDDSANGFIDLEKITQTAICTVDENFNGNVDVNIWANLSVGPDSGNLTTFDTYVTATVQGVDTPEIMYANISFTGNANTVTSQNIMTASAGDGLTANSTSFFYGQTTDEWKANIGLNAPASGNWTFDTSNITVKNITTDTLLDSNWITVTNTADNVIELTGNTNTMITQGPAFNTSHDYLLKYGSGGDIASAKASQGTEQLVITSIPIKDDSYNEHTVEVRTKHGFLKLPTPPSTNFITNDATNFDYSDGGGGVFLNGATSVGFFDDEDGFFATAHATAPIQTTDATEQGDAQRLYGLSNVKFDFNNEIDSTVDVGLSVSGFDLTPEGSSVYALDVAGNGVDDDFDSNVTTATSGDTGAINHSDGASPLGTIPFAITLTPSGSIAGGLTQTLNMGNIKVWGDWKANVASNFLSFGFNDSTATSGATFFGLGSGSNSNAFGGAAPPDQSVQVDQKTGGGHNVAGANSTGNPPGLDVNHIMTQGDQANVVVSLITVDRSSNLSIANDAIAISTSVTTDTDGCNDPSSSGLDVTVNTEYLGSVDFRYGGGQYVTRDYHYLRATIPDFNYIDSLLTKKLLRAKVTVTASYSGTSRACFANIYAIPSVEISSQDTNITVGATTYDIRYNGKNIIKNGEEIDTRDFGTIKIRYFDKDPTDDNWRPFGAVQEKFTTSSGKVLYTTLYTINASDVLIFNSNSTVITGWTGSGTTELNITSTTPSIPIGSDIRLVHSEFLDGEEDFDLVDADRTKAYIEDQTDYFGPNSTHRYYGFHFDNEASMTNLTNRIPGEYRMFPIKSPVSYELTPNANEWSHEFLIRCTDDNTTQHLGYKNYGGDTDKNYLHRIIEP